MKVIKIDTFDNTLPSKFINDEGLRVAVVNAQIGSELLKSSEYVHVPLHFEKIQEGKIMYLGMCGGYKVYVDPYLTWDNNIITLCETIEEYDTRRI